MKTTPFVFRIREELLKRLERASLKDGRAKSEIIRELISKWLREVEKNGPETK